MFQIIETHHVDLIIVDIMLPDGSGLTSIEDIRQHTDIPVILLSGESDIGVKIQGFDLGADDYMTKPCDMNELKARVKSHLCRYHGELKDRVQEKKQASRVMVERVGPWFVDRSQFQLFSLDNVSCDLTLHEFRLLEILLDNVGKVLSREALCEAAREANYVPTARSIDIKIARIRKKIGDTAHNPSYIKTVRGVGYYMDDVAVDDKRGAAA